MSKQTRRKFTSAIKAKVALEAIKNQETFAKSGKKFDVSLIVIPKWKSELLDKLPGIFDRSGSTFDEGETVDMEKLYAQIGQLKVENDFLKKSQPKWGNEAAREIYPPRLAAFVSAGSDLLSVNRSSLYYRPIEEKPENIKMMTLMDKHLISHPPEGVVSMVYFLKALGYPIGPKRIRSLFKLMARETI